MLARRRFAEGGCSEQSAQTRGRGDKKKLEVTTTQQPWQICALICNGVPFKAFNKAHVLGIPSHDRLGRVGR